LKQSLKKIHKKPHVHNNVGKRKSVAPPPKKQIVPSGKKHKFQKENFKHPTYCAICETYIWGLSKAGYHCTDCTFDAHRKCIAQAKKLYCDVSIMQRSTVYIKDADVKNTRWKSSTFTVWLSYGSKTSVFLNPMATLESVLERICQMRSMEFEEHIAEDINGRPLEKNTLLGDIPQGEITFTKKDLTMNFLRRRGQVSRNPIENIKKNDEDTILVKSLEQKVHIKETLEDEGMSENFTSAKEGDEESEIIKKKTPTKNGPRKKYKNIRMQYELGDTVGEGAFSVVKLGIDKSTGEKVAIKIIEKDESNKKLDPLIRREIKIMKDLDHENIVRLFGYDEDKTSFYVVMELVTGGELFEGIIQNRYYPEDEASPLVTQMLSAINYLHKQQIVHRDLKPENVLFTDKKQLNIKIADFGESKKCKSALKTYCGTPDYMAPEIIKGTPYGPEVDMWAIGIITYVLLCGYPTFDGKTELEVMANITAVNYEFPSPDWDYVSDDAKDFIDKILQANPHDRMTAEASLQHNWIVKKRLLSRILRRL